MTSRTRAKYEASRRIVDGIGATFDSLSDAVCAVTALASLAAQLAERMTLDELQAWEAKLAKAESAAVKFHVVANEDVPEDEVHFVNPDGRMVGKITGLATKEAGE